MPCWMFFFFFNDTATTEIYTLSLHDALPISSLESESLRLVILHGVDEGGVVRGARDRKSTRLNSSHGYISYAVFCLKKKKIHKKQPRCVSYPCFEGRSGGCEQQVRWVGPWPT